MVSRDSKVDSFANFLFFFCWLLCGLVFWPESNDPFVCYSPIGVYACHFLGQVLGCTYTICLYGRIEISCTFTSGPPCRPSRVWPYTPSVLICCIRLLCDWSFGLCHRIAYIYCYILPILALIWLVLMALSCAAIRRDSVSLLRFPFLSQVQVFWCEMLFIRRLKRP